MASNPQNKLKLKLKKADTNRLKTETSLQRKQQEGQDQQKAQQQMPPTGGDQPGETAQISDPMALRDTTTGKLRRISSPEEDATALAPASPASPQKGKTETVRLKVVRGKRDQKAPGPQPMPPRPAGDTLNVPPPTRPPAAAPAAPAAAAPAPPPAAAPAPPPAAAPAPPPPPAVAAAKPAKNIEVKRATSTVRVSPPPEQAGTPPEAPPEAPSDKSPDETQTGAPTPYTNTGTSTVKLQIRKPASAKGAVKAQPKPAAPPPSNAPNKNATATLNIRTGAAKTPAGVTPGSTEKDVTATLKIRPGETAKPQPEPIAKPDAAKNVTATLKVRPAGEKSQAPPPEAGPASATVKIKPPTQAKPVAAKVSPEAETKIGVTPPAAPPQPGKQKVSLKLRKDQETDKGSDVTLPGITPPGAQEAAPGQTVALPQPVIEAEKDEASATVAVKAPSEPQAPQKKKGLKLRKPGSAEAVPEVKAEAAPEAQPEEQPEAEPQPAAHLVTAPTGPGLVATLGSLAAAGGLVALTVRLVLDLLSIIK